MIEPGRLTVPGLLRKAGYRTGGFGKWHLGLGWPTLEPAAFGDALKPTGDTALIDFSRPLTGGPHTAGFDEFFGIPASLDMEPYVWIDGNHVVEAPTAMTSGDKSQRAGGGGRRGGWGWVLSGRANCSRVSCGRRSGRHDAPHGWVH